MEHINYDEYEKMKIQEATKIAQKIIDGKEKTIPFKIAMKQLDKQIDKMEKKDKKAKNIKEKELRNITKGGIRYTI